MKVGLHADNQFIDKITIFMDILVHSMYIWYCVRGQETFSGQSSNFELLNVSLVDNIDAVWKKLTSTGLRSLGLIDYCLNSRLRVSNSTDTLENH